MKDGERGEHTHWFAVDSQCSCGVVLSTYVNALSREKSQSQATIRELVEAAEDLMQWCRMNEGDGHGEVPTKLCMAMTKAIHEAKKATNEGRG